MNMIHCFWPTLLTTVDGFVRSMLTPIIKVKKGKEVQAFYTLTEYNKWKAAEDRHLWTTKYFKASSLSEKPSHSKQSRVLDTDRINVFPYCHVVMIVKSTVFSAGSRNIQGGRSERVLSRPKRVPGQVHRALIGRVYR